MKVLSLPRPPATSSKHQAGPYGRGMLGIVVHMAPLCCLLASACARSGDQSRIFSIHIAVADGRVTTISSHADAQNMPTCSRSGPTGGFRLGVLHVFFCGEVAVPAHTFSRESWPFPLSLRPCWTSGCTIRPSPVRVRPHFS